MASVGSVGARGTDREDRELDDDDLDLLEADTKRARGDRPYVMARVRQGIGVAEVVAFLEAEGGLHLRPVG